MSIEIMAVGLLIISTFTGLLTEAIKKFKTDYKANILAGLSSMIVTAIVGFCYYHFVGGIGETEYIVCFIIMIILSWLCSMLGYDKVVQTITQLKKEVE